jgi:anthranilate synthase component 1
MEGLHARWLDTTPDLVALAKASPDEFPFFLESSAVSHHGRHSMLLLASGESWTAGQQGLESTEFLARIRNWYEQERIAADDRFGDIPFRGGWFLYFGYEMAGAVEPVLRLPPSPARLPDAIACRCPGAIVVFHEEAGPRTIAIAEDRRSLERILDRVSDLHRSDYNSAEHGSTARVDTVVEGDPEAFMDGVRRIHEYLLAGDVFQVNLSRRWEAELRSQIDPLEIYAALRKANPAPFSGVMRWNDMAVLSSSPERLIEIRSGMVQTRPIAGTRPRDADPRRDAVLSQELLDNPKERAEHIMLIDLERNDLGRVCEPGSVEVSELMLVESYAHVHHIVSNVRGRLRADAGPIDAIAAVFPGGTITGCPKVRCMEIIAELEGEGRGFYTGSMGYLCRDGDLDLNILIRSMLIDGNRLTFRTGAGIVADSVPKRELAETADKARGLLLAITG